MYDFVVDDTKLADLSEKLGEIATNIRKLTADIYNIIDNDVSSDWQSSAYKEFQTGCHNYEGALKELADMIEFFSVSFREVGDKSSNLISDIYGLF